MRMKLSTLLLCIAAIFAVVLAPSCKKEKLPPKPPEEEPASGGEDPAGGGDIEEAPDFNPDTVVLRFNPEYIFSVGDDVVVGVKAPLEFSTVAWTFTKGTEQVTGDKALFRSSKLSTEEGEWDGLCVWRFNYKDKEVSKEGRFKVTITQKTLNLGVAGNRYLCVREEGCGINFTGPEKGTYSVRIDVSSIGGSKDHYIGGGREFVLASAMANQLPAGSYPATVSFKPSSGVSLPAGSEQFSIQCVQKLGKVEPAELGIQSSYAVTKGNTLTIECTEIPNGTYSWRMGTNEKPEEVQLAPVGVHRTLTLATDQLEPGTYSCKLYVSADGESDARCAQFTIEVQ